MDVVETTEVIEEIAEYIELNDVMKAVTDSFRVVYGVWDSITIDFTVNGKPYVITVFQFMLGVLVIGIVVFKVILNDSEDD